MVCESKKIDSNTVGLRYAEEECPGELIAAPIWRTQDANEFSDFGGSITTLARNPINPSRQRKKGVITDLEASGGYTQDVTAENITRLMQGFLFADAREKPTLKPLNGVQQAVSAVSATVATITAGGVAFVAGRLAKGNGFGVAANNGLHVITASTATSITASGFAVEATPPADADLSVVGHQFAADEVELVLVGGLPALTRAVGGAVDMTTLGLIQGEWVFVGGDAVGNKFAAGQSGFARIRTISATQLIFDKVDWAYSADAGIGITLQLFFGTLIRNESQADLIKRKSYQLERTLGVDADGPQSELLIGAIPNELTLNIATADKVTVDFTFIAMDHVTRTGLDGLSAGTRPTAPVEDAFNTSSDFSRIKLASLNAANANPVPLFAFATAMTLTINNNVSVNKAIGVLGGFDTSAGTFEVGGSATVYFADVLATRAVRNNADVTLDLVMAKNNAGLLFDIPLLTLGDGRAAVEQDQPITLPLETTAAESVFGNTLTFIRFKYLPSAAE